MLRLERNRGYRSLNVWVRAMELAEAVYRAVHRFPGYERYALSSQMRRCATSIPSNIAEGYGRSSRREYLRQLSIANGSLLELKTQTLLSDRAGYIDDTQADEILELASQVGRMLARLSSSRRPQPLAPAP